MTIHPKSHLSIGHDPTTTSSRQSKINWDAPIEDKDLFEEISKDVERLFFRQAERLLRDEDQDETQEKNEETGAYGAFIILTAALQYLASLNAGTAASEVNGKEVRAYCRSFLPNYDADAIWANLRCGLFHRGVPQRVDPNKPCLVLDERCEKHDPNGKRKRNPDAITLAIRPFLEDLRRSLKEMLDEAARNHGLRNKCGDIHKEWRPVPYM